MEEQRKAVREMQDYISEHISEDITIADLALYSLSDNGKGKESERYEWDESNPRIQLEPRGDRGYIELVPVKSK